MAPTVLSKLAASFDYLHANPRGSYRAEVFRFRLQAEPGYVARAWDDPSRLQAFLRAVPTGRYAESAAERLVELQLTSEYRVRRERAFTEKVTQIERGLATAEAGRRKLVRSVATWVRRLAAMRAWGRRMSEQSDELIYAYRLEEPGARCEEGTCTKTISVSYDVPEGKLQSARQAIFDVGMRLDHGGVSAAWLTGPELFTRIGEALRVGAVDPADLVGRAEAIGQSTQVIALAVEPVLPAARCAVDAISPVVLRRVCDGVDLRVVSALEASEEDRIIVEPSLGADAEGPRSDASPKR